MEKISRVRKNSILETPSEFYKDKPNHYSERQAYNIVEQVLFKMKYPDLWIPKTFDDLRAGLSGSAILEGKPEAINVAYAYSKFIDKVESWDYQTPPLVAFISKHNGIGKTHLIFALFKKAVYDWMNTRDIFKEPAKLIQFEEDYLQRDEKFKWFYKERDIMYAISEEYGGQRALQHEKQALDTFIEKPILFIDDLFSTKKAGNENSRRIMLDLIDQRVDWYGRPTVITSNLSLEEIHAEIEPRIASRLRSEYTFNVKSEFPDMRGMR